MCQTTRFLALAFVAIQFALLNRILFVTADITTILIVANSTTPRNRTSYYERIVSNKTDPVTITITSDFHYFVVQVHTFDKVVSLSNSSDFERGSYVAGKDIGLVQPIVPGTGSYNFFLNDFKQQVEYVVSVIPYGLEDPTPGGCITKSPVPYLRAAYNENVVRVKFQQASVGVDCEESDVKLEMYYLPFSRTYNKTAFFNTLRQMATVKDIETNGNKVANTLPFDLHRSYINYVGYGRVFGVVAYWKNHSSAYISVVSYGCNFSTDSCHAGRAIAIALAMFYMVISLTAAMQLEQLTAIFCAVTCCFHVIVPLVSNNVSVLTVSISLLVIIFAGLALYYFNCNVVNAAVASYALGCCFVSMFFGVAAISQITIYHWLVHLSSSILFFTLYKTLPHGIVILSLLWCMSLSIFAGGFLQFLILNNKFYFTLNYYQPVVIDPV